MGNPDPNIIIFDSKKGEEAFVGDHPDGSETRVGSGWEIPEEHKGESYRRGYQTGRTDALAELKQTVEEKNKVIEKLLAILNQ